MSEPQPPMSAWERPGVPWSSGMVTGHRVPEPGPEPETPPEPPRPDGPERRRRQLMIFGGVAGVILAAGLVILLVVIFGVPLLEFGDINVLSTSPERFLRVDADGVVESR
ncbi:hypothetical protein AB0C31_17010, partial [Actinoplanes philippinensis]